MKTYIYTKAGKQIFIEVYNHQTPETTQISFDRCMDRNIKMNLFNDILLKTKNKLSLYSQNSTAEYYMHFAW
jgi:hypothetical protein